MHRLLACVVMLVVSAWSCAQERALQKEVVVPAPVSAVWQSWTTRAGIESFFAPEAEVDARVDGAFHIHMDPFAKPGQKGADVMRFMALQPMKMLSFDWNAPPHLAQVRQQRTFVIVRLFDIDGQSTRVTLHHTGWGEGAEWDQAFAYFDRAWVQVLGNLRKRHESGPVDWSAWLDQLRKMHAAQPAAK